ncbi:MAG: hypothetical protein JWO18_2293 [Microbacteriaceae bacterium]|nr:hypothetical protein [Microbacteriaceae bacterium]
MADFVSGTDIGDAWLNAFAVVRSRPRGAVNLSVEIKNPLIEDLGIRREIELHLSDLQRDKHVQSVHTVANTIFPIAQYRPGEGAAERFFVNVISGGTVRRGNAAGWGTYIQRLVAYPTPDGETTNQLEQILARLRGDRHWADIYEAPIMALGEGAATSTALLHADVRTDSRRRGGPCLAHLSFTLDDGRLSLAALYRHHTYIDRAYGNFVGLGRLMNFLANEAGLEVGNLLVVTGHADDGLPGAAKLLSAAIAASGEPTPIELQARPLGVGWHDLDLPEAARVA